MRKLVLLVFAIATAGLVLAGVSLARGGDDDKGRTSTRLDGYQETPLTISTKGKGTFEARIGSSVIEYTLRYEGLEGGAVLFAHIHLGQRATTGGVMTFLCGGGGKPACPTPAAGSSATVEGTIVPANVQAITGNQGFAAGEFDELVDAIRAGAAYVNVHTTTYGSGEIRGQLGKFNRGHGEERGKGKDKKDN